MQNVKLVILTMVAVLLSATQLYAFYGPNAIDNELYTKDTLVLEPLSSSQTYQEAKLWFLPDYQEKISADGVSKPSSANNCASFNSDVGGKTYIQNPDLTLYSCSGPTSLANNVKCYYDCKCKIAENTCSGYPDATPKSGNGWSNTSCRKFSVSSCSYGTTLYKNTCTALYTLTKCPANGTCTAEDCAGKIGLTGCDKEYKKSGNTCICATTCSNKISSKPKNSDYTYETCTACGVSSEIQSGWSCVGGYHKNSAGTGCEADCSFTDTCSGYTLATKTGCDYGYDSCTACDTTKYKCKACSYTATCSGYTLATESGCKYGYDSCKACNTTKYKCKGCTPVADETDCAYGSKDVDDGCGGKRKQCKTICEDYGGTFYDNYYADTYQTVFALGTTKILEIYKCYTGTTAYNPSASGRCGHSKICATVKTCPSGQAPNADKTACGTVEDCSAYQGWPYTTLNNDPNTTCKNKYSNAGWVSSDGYVTCGGKQYYKCSCVSGYTYHNTYKTCYPNTTTECSATLGCRTGYTCCGGKCVQDQACDSGDSDIVTFKDIAYDPVAYCTTRGYNYETTYSVTCDSKTRCYKCRKKEQEICSQCQLSDGRCGYLTQMGTDTCVNMGGCCAFDGYDCEWDGC